MENPRTVAGHAALRAGDIDGAAELGDTLTGYTDTLTNLMHAAHEDGVDFEAALGYARTHYDAEIGEA